MQLSPEIAAAQAAYEARPYLVYWNESHFAGGFRFHTLDAALEYIDEQWRKINAKCAHKSHGGSWIGSSLRGSYIEGPEFGHLQLSYLLLCGDVDNRPR